MDHPKHPMTPYVPKINSNNDSQTPPDDTAPVCSTAGNDTLSDEVAHNCTHRGGKSKGKKSKNPKEANDQPGDMESSTIPRNGGEATETGKAKPTDESTRDESTGQSTKGETTQGKHRLSAGDLDEREDCERTSKARELVKVAREALDELARMDDEEEVLSEVDGRFIVEE